VLYFENYIVTEPGLTPLKPNGSSSPKRVHHALRTSSGGRFTAMIGAEAIREMLRNRS
jgi:DNA-directed RNA polymerase subunit beta'